MEYSLTYIALVFNYQNSCLNPCSNGILSDQEKVQSLVDELMGLNPCSNGILSDNLKESNLRFYTSSLL